MNETSGSILKPLGGYRQGVIGVHHFPGYDSNMHVLGRGRGGRGRIRGQGGHGA